jgi:hypothetical protein
MAVAVAYLPALRLWSPLHALRRAIAWRRLGVFVRPVLVDSPESIETVGLSCRGWSGLILGHSVMR